MAPPLSQLDALQAAWKPVLAVLSADASQLEAHVPGVSPAQLDALVKLLVATFSRVKVASGATGPYGLAAAVATTSVSTATSACESIARGEYGHLSTFVRSLLQALAAFQSLLALSTKDTRESTVAQLAVALADETSALAAARAAVEDATTRIERAESARLAAAEAAEKAAQSLEKAETARDAVLALEKETIEHSAAISAARERADQLEAALAQANERSVKLTQELERRNDEIAELSAKAKEQRDLVTALLPDAASAGLASAFAKRVDKLEKTRWLWAGVFGGAVLLLCALSAWVLVKTTGSTDPLWLQIIQKLPLAAPLVWLGWFSAVQYGNTLRIQEDYAFKEATSQAFAGFKDHLEHMSRVKEEDGDTAMLLLYNKTMEALAREPLRVFQKLEKDVAPSQALTDALKAALEAHNKKSDAGTG